MSTNIAIESRKHLKTMAYLYRKLLEQLKTTWILQSFAINNNNNNSNNSNKNNNEKKETKCLKSAA